VVFTELYDATQFFYFCRIDQFCGTEFYSIVGAEALHLLSLFDHNLPLLEDNKHITLMLEMIHPNFSEIIIN